MQAVLERLATPEPALTKIDVSYSSVTDGDVDALLAAVGFAALRDAFCQLTDAAANRCS